MIKSFDKDSLKMFRSELDATLKALGQKHGVVFNVGTIRYEANSFRTKLEAKLTSGANVVGDKVYDSIDQVAFDNGYDRTVLSDADLGATFKMGGKTYTIVGAKRSSYKYPILAKAANGKVFKFPLVNVAQCMGRKFKLTGLDQMERDAREAEAEGRAEALAC